MLLVSDSWAANMTVHIFFTESCHGSHNPSKSQRNCVSVQLEHPVKCEALGGKKNTDMSLQYQLGS